MGISITGLGCMMTGDAAVAYHNALSRGRSDEEAHEEAFRAGRAEEARREYDYYGSDARQKLASALPAPKMSRWAHLKAAFGF